MDNYIFKEATAVDVDEILKLIQKRIKWMEQNNIDQWKDNYFQAYPKEYFEEMMLKAQLYVMKDKVSGCVIGAVTLAEEDKYWDDKTQSYYIHNLVTDADVLGIGKHIIKYSEKIAMKRGINKIRLDCQASNSKLNDYYNKLDYKFVGTVQDGDYIGNKREKILTTPG